MACKTCIANSVGPTCKLCSNEGCSYHCYPGYTTCSGCTDGLVLETIFTNPILKKFEKEHLPLLVTLTKTQTEVLAHKLITQKSAFEIWHYCFINKMYYTAKTAERLLKLYREPLEKWRYQHALSCRVIDWWNLTAEAHGIGACYYGLNSRVLKLKSLKKGEYLPSGWPHGGPQDTLLNI